MVFTILKQSVTGGAEFNIIFDIMLVIMHLEVINSIFSISGGVYGTELSVESLDKFGPIIKPVGNVIGVKEGWLKEFQGGPSEIGKHEGHLVRVIGINGIAAHPNFTQTPTPFPPNSHHSGKNHSDPCGSNSYQDPSRFQVDSKWIPPRIWWDS